MCSARVGGSPSNPDHISNLCILRAHYENKWINIVLAAVLTSQGTIKEFSHHDHNGGKTLKIFQHFPQKEDETSFYEERERERAATDQWEYGMCKMHETTSAASSTSIAIGQPS